MGMAIGWGNSGHPLGAQPVTVSIIAELKCTLALVIEGLERWEWAKVVIFGPLSATVIVHLGPL